MEQDPSQGGTLIARVVEEHKTNYRDDNLYLHLRSGVFYKSMYAVGVTYGVPFKDVKRHIWDNVPLFPDWEEFILAK